MLEREVEYDRIREKRGNDIMKRCLLLSPPLKKQVLLRMDIYYMTVNVPRPLSNKAWKVLRGKLEAGRKVVEESIRKEEEEKERKKRLNEAEKAAFQAFYDTWEPAKIKLAEYIDEFFSRNGAMVRKGFESSFAIQALQHTRRKWYESEENKGKQLPFGMIMHLLTTKLINICNGETKLFSCKLCEGNRRYSLTGLLNHVLSLRHKGDERLETIIKPIEGLSSDYYHAHGFDSVKSLDRSGSHLQWLENLPMHASGPVFRTLEPKPPILIYGSILPAHSSLTQTYAQATITDKILPSLDHVKFIMRRELAKTRNAPMPASIRLFLWLRSTTNSCVREHRSLPTVMDFVATAGSLGLCGEDEILGTLKCGACGIWHSTSEDGTKRSLTWKTLGEHFVSSHKKLQKKWTEKLVKAPTSQEVQRAMHEMHEELRERFICLLAEVDAKLVMDGHG